ncbi:MAG: hypothetical protein Fur0032_10230 [Terrimicrobiaceae bacterium]
MKRFLTLLGYEVARTLRRPLAYAVMACFLFLCGLNFQASLSGLLRVPSTVTLSEAFFNSLLFWFPFLLLIPIVTMRLFSEEYKLGTIETLMTAPVRDYQVVLAKFFGALIFYAVLWLPTLLLFGAFWVISGQTPAETLPGLLGGYLLLMFAGAFYLSIGCLASALTDNQIVAAIITLSLVCATFFLGLLWFFFPSESPLLRQLSYYLSTLEHMSDFSRGIFDSRPLAFYATNSAFVLFLTYHALQYRRWRA